MAPRIATSYFGNRTVRHVAADMRRLAAEGFDTVVHTMSENDLAYYRGTLGEIVAASHDAGLEVWLDPWGVGGIFGGEAFSRAALHEPEWRQVAPDGTRLPACCPSHPGFREFVGEWVSAACATGADTVFWDEPHFYPPGENRRGCACGHCRDLAEQRGLDVPEAARAAALLSFLEWACARAGGEGKPSAVCLMPPDGPPGTDLEWTAVGRIAGVRSLGCAPYWARVDAEPEAYVTEVGRRLLAAAAGAPAGSHVWIQGFSIPAGREDEIRTAVLAAGGLAPDLIAIWGFDACAHMSHLACGRPAEAWRAFRDGVAVLREET